MANTPNIGVTLVEQSQSQKEVTVNQALHRIDALLNNSVKSRSLASPPSSPQGGDLYIVDQSASEGWVGKEGQLAYFDQIWRFIVPKAGVTLWIADEEQLFTFDGNAWVAGGIMALMNAPLLSPLLNTDLIPVIRSGSLYLATIEDCLAAVPPVPPSGQLIFNNAGSSGLFAGVL